MGKLDCLLPDEDNGIAGILETWWNAVSQRDSGTSG